MPIKCALQPISNAINLNSIYCSLLEALRIVLAALLTEWS